MPTPRLPLPTIIRFARGPLTYEQGIFLPEGEPFEAGLQAPDGTFFETLYVGGHDGINKLLGGGVQAYADSVAGVSGPMGMMILQPGSNTIWVCNGGANWFALTPGDGGGVSPMPGAVDGGTWT